MTEAAQHTVRRAEQAEAAACGDFLNAWIDQRNWMPGSHSRDRVRAIYRDLVFLARELRQTVGKNEQGLPDVLMSWGRAA